MPRFTQFAAIDWSGQAVVRPKGLALAVAQSGEACPSLISPENGWSRAEICHWIDAQAEQDMLIGLDLSPAFPFLDCGAYFPGWDATPRDARHLWHLVEDIARNDPHLAATSFVDHREAARHFRRHGGREGDLFGGGRGRFRVTERAQEAMGCKPYSTFNLVGAAQVGKSSLTGMRLLHRLDGRLPVWPVDPLPEKGPVVVEIYTTLAAMAAGRSAGKSKMRSHKELNAALAALGSAPVPGSGPIADHASDALLTAAWLRRAAHDPQLWHPPGLTDKIAQTEGWTFGAR